MYRNQSPQSLHVGHCYHGVKRIYFHVPTGGTAGSESEGLIPRSIRHFCWKWKKKGTHRTWDHPLWFIIPMQLNRQFSKRLNNLSNRRWTVTTFAFLPTVKLIQAKRSGGVSKRRCLFYLNMCCLLLEMISFRFNSHLWSWYVHWCRKNQINNWTCILYFLMLLN